MALTETAIRTAIRKASREDGPVTIYDTGGMFLIGYALKLGAVDRQIGLMTTLPMLCVVAQLLAAAVVERGVGRRRLAFGASLLNVAG